jgi:hypothetical protein
MPRLPFDIRRIGVFVGVFILVLLVLDFNARLQELDRLNKQNQVVSAQATAITATQSALQTQVAYAASDQAVDDFARDNHYIQPGDHPVVPVPAPGNTPVVESSPTPSPTPQPNWMVWWELFFGDNGN